MGLIGADNCGDTYDASTAATAAGWSGGLDSIVPGRVEGGAIRLNGGSIITPHQLAKSAPLGSDFTWHEGFMFEGLPGSDTVFVQFIEGSTVHVDLRITASGTLRATRAGTSLALGTAVLSPGVYYQLGVHVLIHDSTGQVHVSVDEVADISVTGVDTRNGQTGSCDRFQIRGEFGWTTRHDDIHYWTGNDDKGNSRVVGRLVDGDGAHTDWDLSGGSDHSALVDDPAPDGDATYVSSDTGGQRDSYTVAALGVDPTATVFAVLARAVTRKLDIGSRVVALFTRVAGTDFDGSDQNPTFGYLPMTQAWEVNPDTTSAWTVAEVDGAEVGILDDTP